MHMGVDHRGGGRRDKSPQNLEPGGLSPQILSCCKILSTRLLALQCRKMCFLPLQQDFYGKSRHAAPRIPVRSTPMCMHDYRFLCLAAMICATLVNTQTHTQTCFDPYYYCSASCANSTHRGLKCANA